MSLLNILGSLTQALPYIRTQYKGKDLKGQRQSAANMANLSDAMVNPNNATYQSVYNQNRGSQQQDLASAIAEISNQNRKLVSMGRTPLLDQERGGESIFRNLIKGNQEAGSNARLETQNQLRGALAGQGANFQAQQGVANSGYENNLLRANAYYGLGGLGRQYQPRQSIEQLRMANPAWTDQQLQQAYESQSSWGSFGDEPMDLTPQTQGSQAQSILKALFGLG